MVSPSSKRLFFTTVLLSLSLSPAAFAAPADRTNFKQKREEVYEDPEEVPFFSVDYFTLKMRASAYPERPWGFGFGVGGSKASSRNKTDFAAAVEIRHLWYNWFESLFIVEMTFADSKVVGVRLPQRIYLPFGKVRPYGQSGYRLDNASRYDSSALEIGGGIHFAASRSVYFEAGAIYVWNSLFNKTNPQNIWLFSGSSGLRF